MPPVREAEVLPSAESHLPLVMVMRSRVERYAV
jgi:hypothetical protein